ncbi:MAG: methionine--tRNA ligase [Promethearchaeota archaeon]|nr:MAG: methionine--tRNA ligase [Candidatus Lokiarchaeota archaeon]
MLKTIEIIEMPKQKWIVTSAWPYVNATPHLGNIIGSVLSGDVFARYLRMNKDTEVLYVSGSDMHGTPIAVDAIKKGISSEELSSSLHEVIVRIFSDWDLQYDNYTQTHNPTHIKFIQDFYLEVQKNGYIVEDEIESYYCPEDDFFLPDRFIEGTCPHCGEPGARGDQCDNPSCGRVLEADELQNPHCKICIIKGKHTTPIRKKTKHWYLDFPQLEDQLRDFIQNNQYINQNAKTLVLNSIKEGLPRRAITRDLKWGIPAPFKGAENKTIYVWFEAVLGYISAVKEWAEIKEQPELFDYYWKDAETKSVYFIGKDNIIFHWIIFPGLILAYNKGKSPKEQLTMPYNVSSTEFLMYENDKFSKSRGVGIWADEALELLPADYWRYALIRNRPEGRDVSFIWSEFENSINELNDKIGNFIHRTFTFIYNKFDAKIPPKGDLDEFDKEILKVIQNASGEIGDLFQNYRLKEAVSKIVDVATKGNVYLNTKKPWSLIKTDKDKAGQVFNICAQLSKTLGILIAPICPTAFESIMNIVKISKPLQNISWEDASDFELKTGTVIEQPIPVFKKFKLMDMLNDFKELRESKGIPFEIPDSVARPASKEPQQDKKKKVSSDLDIISYKFFQKFKFRTARITEIEKVVNNKKTEEKLPLFKFILSVGRGKPKMEYFVNSSKPLQEYQSYIGKDVVYLTNLETSRDSAKVFKDQKHVVLHTKNNAQSIILIIVDKTVRLGSIIR